MTSEQLKQIAPDAYKLTCNIYAPILTAEMLNAGINTKLRICHFLAQILHESGSLQYVREIASGKAYEGRKDLGNTQPGDGVKFKGRGLIQITGRSNYIALGKALGLDLISHPELLETPLNAVKSAIWFWNTHNLNLLADKDDLKSITKRINGGLNGFSEREKFLNNAKKIIL